MSDIKCPICNKPMKQATYDYDKKDNDDTLYMSFMPCDCVCNFAASKAVWQELIRTRKALDVAKNGLKELKDVIACPPDISYETGVSMYADGVLQEITATLENKNGNC